ncbi:MAG TPA: TolC family protein [Vicinamibacteria bacterium]|nr:TolC family protein [Vicinamibacteria bacterium]
MIGKMLGWWARAAAAACVLATGAYAQEPSPTPPPAPLAYPSPAPLPAVEDTRPVLSLSLQDAVARALEHNIDIAVSRYDPQDAAEAVKELKGFYDPLLTSTISRSSATRPASDFFGGVAELETDVDIYNFGVIQQVPTGGSLRVDFQNNKTTTNNESALFNPSNSSNLNIRASQPLLRDFGIDSTRLQIAVAKRNRDISDVQFRQTVVNTVAGVKQLYYDLLYAIDNLEAQRKSLALARKLLDENQIKVRVGTMAPLDVVAAESEVAGREESVILAEAALLDAEDAVRRAIFADNAPQNWMYHIVPTDRPSADPNPVDADTAVRNALEKRTDIVAARKNLENAVDNQRFARNQTLPAVDLQAAYGSVGQAGTQVRDAQGNLLPVPIPGGFGNAFGDVFGFDFPTWTLGVQLSYPIPNRTARAQSARAQIGREQTEATLRRLEIAVTQEVRSAARAVETNFKRVGSTRAARVLQERRLDAEEKRFAAGMSTNFLVTQAQRDLAFAEVSELRAVADYRKSIVNFERVQEAGGGVLFSSTPTAVSAVVNQPTQ